MKDSYYMKEYQHYDGEAFITFNIIELNETKQEVTVAVTDRGRITVVSYDIRKNDKGYYFEYGCEYTKIMIDDFEEVI